MWSVGSVGCVVFRKHEISFYQTSYKCRYPGDPACSTETAVMPFTRAGMLVYLITCCVTHNMCDIIITSPLACDRQAELGFGIDEHTPVNVYLSSFP